MSKYFFSGAHDSTLDEKNRFVLPQGMRHGLVEDGELKFTLALGLGKSLVIYPRKVADQMVERFRTKQHLAKFQKFFTIFFSTLHHTTCDNIGRVTIPPKLRQIVGIEKEIVIAGVLNKIEIWPKQHYDHHLSKLLEGDAPEFFQLCEEAFATLGEGEEDLDHFEIG